MNLSASVTLLAAFTVANNQSYVHELHGPDVTQRTRAIRCFNCGAHVDDRTWCNNPTEANAPVDGIKDCFYEYDVCAKSLTVESTGYTVVERRCSFQEVCSVIQENTGITVKRCDTCNVDLCNANDGTKRSQSIWLVVTFMLTIALNLMF